MRLENIKATIEQREKLALQARVELELEAAQVTLTEANARELFLAFDQDDSGSITREELSQALETIDVMESTQGGDAKSFHELLAESKEIFRAMDTDDDGEISVEEFIVAMTSTEEDDAKCR